MAKNQTKLEYSQDVAEALQRSEKIVKEFYYDKTKGIKREIFRLCLFGSFIPYGILLGSYNSVLMGVFAMSMIIRYIALYEYSGLVIKVLYNRKKFANMVNDIIAKDDLPDEKDKDE